MKKIASSLFLFTFITVSACAHVKSEVSSTSAELENTCYELTRNDPENRTYKPVVGRYWGQQSYFLHYTDSPYLTHDIVLKAKEHVVSVHVSFLEREYDQYMEKIAQTIEVEYIKQNKNSDEYYGICAQKKAQNLYHGIIETLTLVRKE